MEVLQKKKAMPNENPKSYYLSKQTKPIVPKNGRPQKYH
jgi:hypothetical protein